MQEEVTTPIKSKEIDVNTVEQTNDPLTNNSSETEENDSSETLKIASSSDNPILTDSSKKVLMLKLIDQQWYIIDEESKKKTLIAQPEKQELIKLLNSLIAKLPNSNKNTVITIEFTNGKITSISFKNNNNEKQELDIDNNQKLQLEKALTSTIASLKASNESKPEILATPNPPFTADTPQVCAEIAQTPLSLTNPPTNSNNL